MGHYKRDCLEFLKYLLENGNSYVTFIDESLFLEFPTPSWWIDSGAPVHVANCLQGFRTIKMLEGRERTTKVANG